jgi:hypothetical protein
LGIELNTGSGYVSNGNNTVTKRSYALYAKSSGTNSTVGPLNAILPSMEQQLHLSIKLSADASNGGIITAGIQTLAVPKHLVRI